MPNKPNCLCPDFSLLSGIMLWATLFWSFWHLWFCLFDTSFSAAMSFYMSGTLGCCLLSDTMAALFFTRTIRMFALGCIPLWWAWWWDFTLVPLSMKFCTRCVVWACHAVGAHAFFQFACFPAKVTGWSHKPLRLNELLCWNVLFSVLICSTKVGKQSHCLDLLF